MAEETTLLADAQEATSWHSGEYKDLVAQRGWENADGVLKSYNELDKSASGKVKIPTDESSPEERSAFYTKIGVPDNPDGYEIKDMPENIQIDDGLISKLRQDAYDAGVPKVAFEAVFRKHLQALSEQAIQSRVEGEKTLKEEWKDDYEPNLEISQRACTELCDDEFKQLLKDTGLGNHPVFLKNFLNIGKKILSDTLIKGDTKGEKEEEGWKPTYPDSPDMYKAGDDEDSQKARQWFIDRGHVY